MLPRVFPLLVIHQNEQVTGIVTISQTIALQRGLSSERLDTGRLATHNDLLQNSTETGEKRMMPGFGREKF